MKISLVVGSFVRILNECGVPSTIRAVFKLPMFFFLKWWFCSKKIPGKFINLSVAFFS